MGVKTELGWACQEAARLGMGALVDRPHQVLMVVRRCLVPNLVNPNTVQSGSTNSLSTLRGSRKVNHNLRPLGTYNTAREKRTLDLKLEGELWPSPGKEEHSTRTVKCESETAQHEGSVPPSEEDPGTLRLVGRTGT